MIIDQHLIDPEICIRCNTCEATCPVGAVTHDDRNYVVDVETCNLCMACIAPCPTGSIDNWRKLPRVLAYSVEAQLGWDELPPPLSADELAASAASDVPADAVATAVPAPAPSEGPAADESPTAARYGAHLPPWSAAHAFTNLYGPKAEQRSITATVTGNLRVTVVGTDYDTHHIVLDFGAIPFPVLEGQSIGIVPPASMATADRTTRGSTAWPAPATASARTTTTCR